VILFRYVFFEIAKTFLLAFLGLSAVIFIAFMLSQLHSVQGASLGLLLQIFPNLLPDVLLITIPSSVLLAVTFGIGRLAGDNELNAMRANGVNLGRVLVPGMMLGLVCSVACFYVIHVVIPAAHYNRRHLLGRALEGLLTSRGTAVRQIRLGDQFIRFKDFRDGRMIEADIFLVDRQKNRECIRAREARLLLDEGGQRLVLDLRDAVVTFQSDVKKRDIQSDLIFERVTREIDVSDRFSKNKNLPDLVDRELLAMIHGEMATRYGREELTTEYHRRKALSMAPLLFAIAAGPLSMLLKRGGRVTGLAAVVLPVIVVYFPLVFGGQKLAEQGLIPPLVGAYAGDAVLAVAGLVTFRRFVLL